MIMELPEKFNMPYAEIAQGELILEQPVRFEDLVYDLTYALKKKHCVYCDKRLKKYDCTIDHRYPRATGGISITNNLFPCCVKHNSDKNNLTHDEYMVAMTLEKNQRRNYEKILRKQKQKILDTVGFILPDEWVEYIDAEEIKYQKPQVEFRGKKYYQLLEFYHQHKKLPRPIIVDKENQLLDGYNVLVFAKDFEIQYIPVVKLENVIVLKYYNNDTIED